MRIFVSSKGRWPFSQNENVRTRCYYHPIFGSIIALGAIINELGEIAQRFNKQANDIELGGINYRRENHERKNGGS
ncbi:MAG: hypothetical protein ABIL39_03300 [candidate division WOR-3 bacterium]